MNRYYFIINPASRKGGQASLKEIKTFFQSSKEEIKIDFWTSDKTVLSMVNQAVENGYNIIVACGGDGTIMEVGKALIGRDLTMGIIPLGSGNGIARHFSIPTNIQDALDLLKTQKTQKMDVGKANEHLFFGNIGFGLEVEFIKAYQKKKLHGLMGYAIALLNAFFRFRYNTFQLIEGEKSMPYTPYSLMISNTNEQGYGRTLTPKADTTDGKLNLVGVPRQNWLKLFSFMFQMGIFKHPILKNKLLEKEITQYQVKGKRLPFPIQIDGEYIELNKNIVTISVLEGGLTIITG